MHRIKSKWFARVCDDNSNNVHFLGVGFIFNFYELAIKSVIASSGPIMIRRGLQKEPYTVKMNIVIVVLSSRKSAFWQMDALLVE